MVRNSERREDTFLDIPLPIKPFNSVEEALRAFIQPEILRGVNQYQSRSHIQTPAHGGKPIFQVTGKLKLWVCVSGFCDRESVKCPC